MFKYLIGASHTKAQKCLYLMICHLSILLYQFVHCINILWYNNWFWMTFREFVLERTTTTIEFLYQFFLFSSLLYSSLDNLCQKVMKNNHTKMFTSFPIFFVLMNFQVTVNTYRTQMIKCFEEGYIISSISFFTLNSTANFHL